MKRPSVHQKLFWFYSIPVLILMFLMLICCGLSIYNLNRQVTQLDQAALQNYADQLETNLNAIEMNVQTFTTVDNDTIYMQYLTSEAERVFATTRVFRRMEVDVIEYPSMSAEFLCPLAHGAVLMVRGEGQSLVERQQVNHAIETICQDLDDYPTGSWQYYTDDAAQYLLYSYQLNDAYFGFLLDPVKLMTVPFAEDSSQYAETSLYLNNKRIAGVEASSENCLSAKIGRTGFELRVRLVRTGLTNGIVWLSLLMMVIPLLLLAALFLLYRFARLQIVEPIDRISQIMHQAGQGDLSVRVDTSGMLQEFSTIGTTFNLTLEEISELQERQTQILREKQMSQLRNLQMQINPHFLGNCFNAVYNASLTGDFEQVLALTTYLNRYFRFMAQVENDLVLLEEELRFTDDFLSIQKLRFGDAFSYTISVPAFLRQARVPPSVIKSFAENAVKYARNMSGEAKIDIRASMQNREGKTRLWLEVLDNGPGFSDEVLQVMQQKAQPFFDGRVHIGIANVRQRLELLYAGKAEVHLENRPDGGAHVSVILPLNYGTEQPEKEETP